jgi:gluconolactonase
MPDGTVIVTEIARGTITRCHSDGRAEVVATTGGGPNGAAIGPDGALYVCNNGGSEHIEIPSRGWLLPGDQGAEYIGGRIQRVDLVTGAVTDLYTECDGNPLRGPNDLVFDGHGGFWFTDHGKTRPRDRDRGGLYYARADGRGIREVLHPLDGPNGVGLSPDGTRVYVAETHVGRLWAWDVLEPGVVGANPKGRVFGGELLLGLGGYNLLDSMAIDEEGNVCVATIGDKAGITVVSHDGSRVEHVPLPDPVPTNVCFGGDGLRTAYATLSASGQLVSWEWPCPGLRLAHT